MAALAANQSKALKMMIVKSAVVLNKQPERLELLSTFPSLYSVFFNDFILISMFEQEFKGACLLFVLTENSTSYPCISSPDGLLSACGKSFYTIIQKTKILFVIF